MLMSFHDLCLSFGRGMRGDIGETAWALDSKGRERRRALPKYQYLASWMVVVSCLDGAEQVVGAESVD